MKAFDATVCEEVPEKADHNASQDLHIVAVEMSDAVTPCGFTGLGRGG